MIHLSKRKTVKEVTLDLSPTMMRIVRTGFPNATMTNDRFHVQKLFYEAIDELRITYRWMARDLENDEIQRCKEQNIEYVPFRYTNGDTRKQLLARAKHVLVKHYSKWTESQRIRAEIIFDHYPELKSVYDLAIELTNIYNKHYDKDVARGKLALWYNKIGSVVILGGLSLVNSLHAYTFASLKRKKLISTTPLNDALNALILALNASAAAFVLLFTKKFKILS